MAERSPSRPPSVLLEPPPKGVELEDPGAQESGAESEDDHFSDASEGRTQTERPRVHISSPEQGNQYLSPGLSPGGSPVPRTVVEKINPDKTSYGEEPGTPAYEARKMDAVPDLVYKAGEWDPQSMDKLAEASPSLSPETTPPETKLTRVPSLPERAASPLTAHRWKPSDTKPDVVEDVQDPEGLTPSSGDRISSPELNQAPNDESGQGDIDSAAPLGDDFDDFKEGDDDADHDDFGDFDNEFQEASPDAVVDIDHGHSSFNLIEETSYMPAHPPLDFSSLDSLSDLLTAGSDHLDTLFPKSADLSSLPPIDPIPESSAIFNSERSLSLWSQLVAPPPLQPPNWTKSRIRRLFLVSLGVPVDLDEILPASKQKKLVLPSVTSTALHKTGRKSNDARRSRSSRPKKSQEGSDQATARSSTSTDAGPSRSGNNTSRRNRGPPAPELDLSAVRRLCSTTDAALDGLTDEEMQEHVKKLEEMTSRASEVLQYWLQKRDGQIGEKEAYDGVIENLVKHARQVRS